MILRSEVVIRLVNDAKRLNEEHKYPIIRIKCADTAQQIKEICNKHQVSVCIKSWDGRYKILIP